MACTEAVMCRNVRRALLFSIILFLIYVNDINRHVHLGACNLYADDTLVYCSGSTMSELKHNIQQCVSDFHEWYDQNKLVINTSKSSVMLATTRQRILHIGPIVWKSLPDYIKTCGTLHSFKAKMKLYIMN